MPGEECGGGKPDQAAADDQNVGLHHHARPGFGPITPLFSLSGAVRKTGFPFFGSCTKYTRDPQGPGSIVRRGGRVVECTALEIRSPPSCAIPEGHLTSQSVGHFRALRRSLFVLVHARPRQLGSKLGSNGLALFLSGR